MRFMMIVKANAQSEAGVMPSQEMLEEMGRFNQSMMDAGVFVTGDGLKASSQGARVNFQANGARTVTDGPFAETKELIAGFWIIKTNSLEEAIEWAKKSPNPAGEGVETHIEIRPFFEMEDFA